jgi:hypothetical protein
MTQPAIPTDAARRTRILRTVWLLVGMSVLSLATFFWSVTHA